MGGACSLGPKHTKNPITKHSFIYTPSSHSSPAKKNRSQNTNKNINLDTQDDQIEKQQKQSICQSETEVLQLNKRVNQQIVDALYYKIGRYFMEEGTIKSEEQVKGTQKWKQFLDDGQITLNKLTKQKRLEIFTPNHPEGSLSEIEKSLAVSVQYSQKMTKLDFFLTKGFVPQQDRWSAWKTKVGVFVYFQKDIYDNLKNQDCPCLKNILKDVGRTFVGQKYFKVQEKKQQTPQLTKQSLREFQKEIEEKNRLENTKQLAQQDQNQGIVGSEKYEDEFVGENSPTGKNCQSNDGSRVNYRRIDLSENYQSPIQQQQRQIVFQQQKQVNCFQNQFQSPSAAAASKPKNSSDAIHQVSSHSVPSVGQESLHRVLRALSNYFPQLKYTQGMNFIIGFFLLLNGGDEEEAFWMFASLAQNENFFIMGLYENSFPLIDILKFMLEVRLKSSMPELHYHIRENLEIIYEEWFFQWAITLFLDKFALKEAIRFWDYIISEGNIFSLISLSLSILKELKNKILQVQDHGEFHELFNRLREDATFMDSNEKQLLSVEAILNGARKLRLDKKVILNLAKEYIISQNPVIQNTKQRVNIYSCYLSSKDQNQAVKTLRRGMQLRILQNIIKIIDKNESKSSAVNADKNKNDYKDTQSDERRVIQKPLIDSLGLEPYFNLKKHIKPQAFSVDGEEDIKHNNQQPRPQWNRGLLPPIKQGRNRANLLHFPDESNEPAKNKLKTINKTDKDYPHKDNNNVDDDHSSLKGIENRQYDCNSINNKQNPLPPLNIRWSSLSNRKEKDKKLFSETNGNGLVTNIDSEYNQTPLVVDNKNVNVQRQEFNNSKGAFYAAKQQFHSPRNVKKTIRRANSQSFQTTQEQSTNNVSKKTKILLNQQLFPKQSKESPLDGLISRNKELDDDFNCISKGIKHAEVQSYSVNSSRRQSFNSQGKEEVQKKKSSQLMIGSAQGTPQQTESQSNINYTSNDTKSRLLSSQQSQQTTPLQQQFQSEAITNKEFCLTSPVEKKGDLSRNNAMKRQFSREQHSGSSSRKKNKFIKVNHPQVLHFTNSMNYQPDQQINSFAVENDSKQQLEKRLEGIQDLQNRTKEPFNNKDQSVEQSNSQNEVKNNSDDEQDKDSHKDSNTKKCNEQDTDSTINHKDIEQNNAKNQSASLQEEHTNPQTQNDNSCINLEYHEVDNFQENKFSTRDGEKEAQPTERSQQQGRQSVISGQREGVNISGYINNLHPQNISGFSEHINSLSAAQLGQISQTKKDLSILQIHSPTDSTGQRRNQVEDNEQQQYKNKQQQSSNLHEKVKLPKESITLSKNTKNQLEQSPVILFDESVNSIQMSTARCAPLPQFTPRTERREQQQLPPKITSQAIKSNSKGSKQPKCSSLSHIGTNLVQNSNSQPKSIAHLLQNEENNNKHASFTKPDNQSHKIFADNPFSEHLERVQTSQQQQQSDKFNNFVMNSGQQQQLGMTAPSTSRLQQIEEEICISSDKQLPFQYPIALSPQSRKSTNLYKNSYILSNNLPRFNEIDSKIDNQKNNTLNQSLDMQDQQPVSHLNSSHMSSKTNESQHSKLGFTSRDKLKHDINLPQNQQTIDRFDKTCIGHHYQNTLGNRQIMRSIAQKNILNNSVNTANTANIIRSQSIHAKGNDLILPQSRPSSKQQRHKSSASEDLKAIATASQS